MARPHHWPLWAAPVAGSGPFRALGGAWLASLAGNGKALFTAAASTPPSVPQPAPPSVLSPLSPLPSFGSEPTSRDSYFTLISQVPSVVISPLILSP